VSSSGAAIRQKPFWHLGSYDRLVDRQPFGVATGIPIVGLNVT